MCCFNLLHLQPEGLGPPMRLDEFLERRAREVLPHVEGVAEAAHGLDEGRDGGVRAHAFVPRPERRVPPQVVAAEEHPSELERLRTRK